MLLLLLLLLLLPPPHLHTLRVEITFLCVFVKLSLSLLACVQLSRVQVACSCSNAHQLPPNKKQKVNPAERCQCQRRCLPHLFLANNAFLIFVDHCLSSVLSAATLAPAPGVPFHSHALATVQ